MQEGQFLVTGEGELKEIRANKPRLNKQSHLCVVKKICQISWSNNADLFGSRSMTAGKLWALSRPQGTRWLGRFTRSYQFINTPR